ncbi:hypothetical protein HNP55_003913 [Paucibacter oligotrophus]|uniref:LiaF transmembrane domain-containing protein n=1 Tax=Roseateles oligotrophus TaxID=1769250 RepID=A0A840LFE5_9BURK|nr:hypothetical protein [Roseateles oligotrophus]MBB4845363.1 hypothetical protein [Roseateles oligotrophus]
MSIKPPRKGRPQDHVFAGLCLIVIGLVALLEQRGYHLIAWLWAHWPLALGAVGLVRLVTARDLNQVGSGVLILLLSAWLYACEMAYLGMDYYNSWPVLLVGLGLWKLVLGALSLRQENTVEVTVPEQKQP